MERFYHNTKSFILQLKKEEKIKTAGKAGVFDFCGFSRLMERSFLFQPLTFFRPPRRGMRPGRQRKNAGKKTGVTNTYFMPSLIIRLGG